MQIAYLEDRKPEIEPVDTFVRAPQEKLLEAIAQKKVNCCFILNEEGQIDVVWE